MASLIFLLFLAADEANPQSATPTCATAIVDEAYRLQNIDALTSLAEFGDSSATDLERHTAAFAQYRLSLLSLVQQDKRTAKRQAKRGLKIMDRLSEPTADDLALIGALYSVRIRTSTMSAIFLGKKSEKLVDRGLEIDSSNPRALLIKATATFFKPGTFGGGLDRAKPLVAKTENAYAASSGNESICWGHADRLALEARVAAASDNADLLEARLTSLRSLAPNHPELQLLAQEDIR